MLGRLRTLGGVRALIGREDAFGQARPARESCLEALYFQEVDAETDHAPRLLSERDGAYSTVTVFARFRGWSTLRPRFVAMWYAKSCSGTTASSGWSSQ